MGHKNRRKHNQYIKRLFFTTSLHFVKSNQKCTYRKLNLSLTRSIYLVFLPLEMQRNLNRPKYTTRFYFTLSDKKRPINL